MSIGIHTYPVRVEGHLDPGLSRWLWLFKWLLVIPHYLVLVFLWIAFGLLSVVAFFAILFTGRYPRGIFDFNVGVLRWTWRVGFYAYGANGTDRYPPFTLAETDYPATFTVEYPEKLSRGLVLVKWWLLAIPHYLIVAFFVGGGGWLVWQGGETAFRYGGGLIAVLVLIAAMWLLFTGRYPQTIFDFVLGLNRWALRVAAYAGLMTDRYPPFRLDMGATEPAAIAVGREPPVTPPTTAAARPGGWTAGRVLLVVFGSLATLIAVALLVGGGTVVVFDQAQRDDNGFVMSPTEGFSTPTFALVSERVETAVEGPDWAAGEFLGDVQIRSESAKPVFVGIAAANDVARYLANVEYEEVRDLRADPGEYARRAGTAAPAAPGSETFWAASSRGGGEQTVLWEPADGTWRVVVMNLDGSAGVEADLSIGAEFPQLLWIGVGLLAGGAVLVVIGVALLYLGVRRREQPIPSA